MALRKPVTLSDGTQASVTLRPQTTTEYYPDLPHCQACGLRTPLLWQCDAPHRGRGPGRCGRYCCAACRAQQGTRDLCPTHAPRTRKERR